MDGSGVAVGRKRGGGREGRDIDDVGRGGGELVHGGVSGEGHRLSKWTTKLAIASCVPMSAAA